MDCNCIKIQRFYRKKKLNNLINDTNINSLYNTNDFNDLSSLIINKKLIDKIYKILILIKNISNIETNIKLIPQEFLSSFIIYYYSNEIFNNDESILIRNPDYNILIKLYSEKINILFKKLINNINYIDIRIFYKILLNYKSIFIEWKKQDLLHLNIKLTKMYYDIENVKLESNNNDSNIDIQYFDKLQRDLLMKMDKLDKKRFFNNYKNDMISLNIDSNLESHFKNIMLKAFWDKLYFELKENPPKYDLLKNILIDLKKLLSSLIPNRIDIQDELNDKIDETIIINMLDNNVMDKIDIKLLSIYIISLIKMFQPPIMDNEIEKWEINMINALDNNYDFVEYIMIFLPSVFNMIECIKVIIHNI